MINVVAGIIFNSDQQSVLLALRKPEQHQGGRWEFPGGKQEGDETLEAALSRELLEEINLTPKTFQFRRIIEHRYADKAVRLHFYDVTEFSGIAQGREGQTVQWVPVCDLDKLEIPAANRLIVDELLAGCSNS
ncbi:MAG: (deoxy)nucleoside triphosphate pyrophosphohydrolase [Granulosicoccus sp.]